MLESNNTLTPSVQRKQQTVPMGTRRHGWLSSCLRSLEWEGERGEIMSLSDVTAPKDTITIVQFHNFYSDAHTHTYTDMLYHQKPPPPPRNLQNFNFIHTHTNSIDTHRDSYTCECPGGNSLIFETLAPFSLILYKLAKIRVGGSPWMTANFDPCGSRAKFKTGSV